MALMSIVFLVISVVCFISAIVIRVYRARHYRDLYNPLLMHRVTRDDFIRDARLWDLQTDLTAVGGGFFLVSTGLALLGWVA